MQVEVNKKPVRLSPDATLGSLARQLELQDAGTAIAVNNKMIPRTRWEGHLLSENDKIVVVKAACGG